MQVNNRYFESPSVLKLCAFEVLEGDTWARPVGSEVVHCEPIVTDGYMAGVYIWALVPHSSVYEEDGRG